MSLMTANELHELSGLNVGNAQAEAMIALGQEIIEQHLNRKLPLDDYEESRREFDGRYILLRAYPVQSVQGVTVNGVPVENYKVDDSRGVLLLPRTARGDVVVHYRGGFASVPTPIKAACAIIAQAVDRAQENAGQNVVSERLDGYSVSYSREAGSGLATLSPVAAALLKPYKSRVIM